MKLRSLIAYSLPAFAIAAATIACTAPAESEKAESSESAIVGGIEATPGAWAGTVALYKGSSQVCGGALVADEWVLTAAHCVSASSPTGGFTKVVIGRHRLSSATDGESITVKKAFRHPGFSNATLDNDIALIQLNAKSNSPVSKLLSSNMAQSVDPPNNVTVVGWGTTSQGGASSDVLREVTVPLISNATCKGFSQYEDVTANMICAGLTAGGKDSCQGDSGGPLFQKINGEIRQVGIVSWGIGCARPNAPGVYTRISNYFDWLKTNSGGAVGNDTPVGDGGTPVDPPVDGGPAPDGGPVDPTDAGPGPSFTPFEESGSVARNEEKAYSFDAPAGTYTVELSGTGGDADLYVKKNEAASPSNWDCRPYISGSNEECTVTLAAAGKLHVMVRGYANATSNFTVKGTKN